MTDNIMYDLRQTLQEADRESCFFLAGKINRMMERNKFGLFWDKGGELTSLGEILAGLFEIVLVDGYLKMRRDEDDGIS